MSDTKFTPGPWATFYNGDEEYCVSMGTHRDSPYCYEPKHLWKCEWTLDDSEEECDTESQANADLISAAPDMYKALQEMCDMWTTVCDAQGWEPEHMVQYKNAMTSLSKARGESHE